MKDQFYNILFSILAIGFVGWAIFVSMVLFVPISILVILWLAYYVYVKVDLQ